jgi:hypothetical protein
MDSYAEASPSGSGVRIVAYGEKPDRERSKNGWVEIYDGRTAEGKPGGRYLTITGQRLDGAPHGLAARQQQLEAVYFKWLKVKTTALTTTSTSSNSSNGGADNALVPIIKDDDEALIDKARAAENGPKFQALWSGSTAGYPSHSEADLALVSILSFWCGPDAERIDRLFRRSGLMRAKWEEPRGAKTYGRSVIDKALSGRREFYTEGGSDPEAVEADHEEDDRLKILDVPSEDHRTLELAAQALYRDTTIFQRGGSLVSIVCDQSPAANRIRRPLAPRVALLPKALLGPTITKHARWLECRTSARGTYSAPGHPSDRCMSALHALGYWPGIRTLEAMTTYPELLPDGTVLSRPGYDESTGLLFEPLGDVPAIPEKPTLDDAMVACKALLDVVSDFPFAAEKYKAAWMAALLTALCRFAFKGPAPFFLFDANTRGSGKTLLTQVISNIVTGAEFPTASYTDDEAELRKSITSVAMMSLRMVLFDNISGNLGNATLNRVLTTTSWDDRILGYNKRYTGPIYATWYGTSNNCSLHPETVRRTLMVRLESNLEQPELRYGFAKPRLIPWVQEHRDELLDAALTILRAYCVAGRPDQKLPAWGSFEAWSDLVRNAIVWLDLPDPGECRQELGAYISPADQAMKVILRCWQEMDPKGKGYTAVQVIKLLYPKEESGFAKRPDWHSEMKVAIETLTECTEVGRLPRQLGTRLRDNRRRVFDGRMFDQAKLTDGVAKWIVRSAEDRGQV